MSRCSHDQSKPRRRFVQKLSAYAATGGALIAADASAGIIHANLGPNGVTVSKGTFDVDMNADGLVDFVVRHLRTSAFTNSPSGTPDSDSSSDVAAYAKRPAAGWSRGIVATLGNSAKAFYLDENILPSAADRTYVHLARVYSTGTGATDRGEFYLLQRRGFLGVAFGPIGLPRHAGWIEVEAAYPDHFTVFGFAYETEPGKGIAAGAVPEPPSLLLLAAGATGLGMLRRKRRSMKSESTPSGR